MQQGKWLGLTKKFLHVFSTGTIVNGIELYAQFPDFHDVRCTYYVDFARGVYDTVLELGTFDNYEEALIQYDIYMNEEEEND